MIKIHMHRVSISERLLNRQKINPLLNRIKTAEEKCFEVLLCGEILDSDLHQKAAISQKCPALAKRSAFKCHLEKARLHIKEVTRQKAPEILLGTSCASTVDYHLFLSIANDLGG